MDFLHSFERDSRRVCPPIVTCCFLFGLCKLLRCLKLTFFVLSLQIHSEDELLNILEQEPNKLVVLECKSQSCRPCKVCRGLYGLQAVFSVDCHEVSSVDLDFLEWDRCLLASMHASQRHSLIVYFWRWVTPQPERPVVAELSNLNLIRYNS
jgi:hypothetical protein